MNTFDEQYRDLVEENRLLREEQSGCGGAALAALIAASLVCFVLGLVFGLLL